MKRIIVITMFTITIAVFANKAFLEGVKSDLENIYGKVMTLENKIVKMSKDANKDNDFKLKSCLDDQVIMIKGISANIMSSKIRITNLARIDKIDAIEVQHQLAQALGEKAVKVYSDALNCKRSMGTISRNITVETEVDESFAGSRFEDDQNVLDNNVDPDDKPSDPSQPPAVEDPDNPIIENPIIDRSPEV